MHLHMLSPLPVHIPTSTSPQAPAAAPVIVATTASWVCPAKLELKGQEALWEHPEQTVALDVRHIPPLPSALLPSSQPPPLYRSR